MERSAYIKAAANGITVVCMVTVNGVHGEVYRGALYLFQLFGP
jgi:hypothetical protein